MLGRRKNHAGRPIGGDDLAAPNPEETHSTSACHQVRSVPANHSARCGGLSRAGIPMYTTGVRGGGIARDENYRVTLTGLKEAEIQTLLLASKVQLLREIGLGKAAENALLKVSAAVPAQYPPSLEFMRQRFYIDPIWWWHDADPPPFLGEIQQAVYESRCLRAVYEHRHGGVVEHLLEPYSLVAKSSEWYLIARRDGELRTYRISRFHTLVLLDTHFCRAEDFDLITYWHQHLQEFAATVSDYTFTLRFHESRLPFVRRLMPGRSTILEPGNGDGWVRAHFHVESMDFSIMLWFGLVTQVSVVEPPALHAEVVQTACEMIKILARS